MYDDMQRSSDYHSQMDKTISQNGSIPGLSKVSTVVLDIAPNHNKKTKHPRHIQ
jgi:hypothetical protein